jgi:arginase
MANLFILTPYSLDTHVAEIERLPFPGAIVNTPTPVGGDMMERMGVYHRTLRVHVENALAHGQRPVAINGDCVATLGVHAALQRQGISPTLLWLDAHGDFNTPETTPSGFLGGMPLAMLCGLGDQTLMNTVGARPIPAHQVVLADGRDLDPGEETLVHNSGIWHVDNVTALQHIRLPNRPLWVHFDTDVLNLADMPAASYPARGGPSVDELCRLLARTARENAIAAITMTVWTFALDSDGRGGSNSLRALACLTE